MHLELSVSRFIIYESEVHSVLTTKVQNGLAAPRTTREVLTLCKSNR